VTVFAARYKTECPACEQDINVDDEATWTADRDVVHFVCPPPPKVGVLCLGCYQEKALNGKCGCED
jgi:hypothetical protein